MSEINCIISSLRLVKELQRLIRPFLYYIAIVFFYENCETLRNMIT